MIKILDKSNNRIVLETDMETSLANAIRRSVGDIDTLAIDEVDIYKNDSALYDEIIAHRLGLVPLENQKLKDTESCSCGGEGCSKCTIEMKFSVKGDENATEVFSKELGDLVVYDNLLMVLLDKGQELEVVAKARTGKGKNHAKHLPGLIYYREGVKIDISKDGEKHSELAEMYPSVFEFSDKLKVKNEWACDLEEEDLKDFKGVEVKPTGKLVMIIESWGQIDIKDIFLESAKSIKSELNDLAKALK